MPVSSDTGIFTAGSDALVSADAIKYSGYLSAELKLILKFPPVNAGLSLVVSELS